jgi:hypothetical protein
MAMGACERWLLACALATFAVIAVFIDAAQAMGGHGHPAVPRTRADWERDLEGAAWPPAAVRTMFVDWADRYDPLLLQNPLWYRLMASWSPLLYLPVYLLTIAGLLLRWNAVRLPALIWASLLLASMVVILAEQLVGPYAAPDPARMLMAYGAYVVVPLWVLLRFLPTDTPFGSAAKKQKHY